MNIYIHTYTYIYIHIHVRVYGTRRRVRREAVLTVCTREQQRFMCLEEEGTHVPSVSNKLYVCTKRLKKRECKEAGYLNLQVFFHKTAAKYKVLLRKMTYKDKASYASSPPSTYIQFLHTICMCGGNRYVEKQDAMMCRSIPAKQPLITRFCCWK